MKIVVHRKWPRANYCVGIMYIDGKRFCETLEDRIVDVNKNGRFDGTEKKVFGESAIPYGKYKVIYNYSPKFKRKLPRLLDVPHFDGVLIHSGNTAKDSAGCILIGRNTSVGRLTESRIYSDKLNKLIEAAQAKGEPITIEFA